MRGPRAAAAEGAPRYDLYLPPGRRGALAKPIACMLCGREFTPHRGGSLHYCDTCRAKTLKEIAKVLRVRCKECGKAFSATNRVARYCSVSCRMDGYRRNSNASARHRRRQRLAAQKGEGAAGRGGAPKRPGGARGGKAAAPKCRVCGGKIASYQMPGNRRVYCSAKCRAEGKRVQIRDYMRRYLSDPKKRAIMAARANARAARLKAEPRVHCKECGKEFSATRQSARYCSVLCRKKWRAR